MKRKIVNLLIGSLLLSAAASHAEVVFDEDFQNSGGDAGLNLVGWHANLGSDGTAVDESSTDWALNPIISGGDYIFYNLTTDSVPVLTWTDKTEVGSIGAISSVTNISLTLNNQSISEDLKVALKVGGAWYVSQDVLNNATANAISVVDLAVQSVSWNSLSLIPGTTLAEGGAVSLPSSGDVQAVGVFDASDTAGMRVRIQNFTVESTTVLEETFDNPLGDQPLTNINWNANISSNGTTYTGSSGGAGPILSGGSYIFYIAHANPWIAWTDKASFGSFGNVVKISLSLADTLLDEDIQVAIKVDDSWYVSQEGFNNSVSNVWQHGLSLDVQSAAWNHLVFIPDSTLAVGDAATNALSGTVQAVGVYDIGSGQRVRVDNFTVKALQETAPYAAWTGSYSLSGSDAEMGADPDSDDMDNLVEYALGGNPTNADSSAILPISELVDVGGTNWLEYVYHRRLDAAARGLTYEVMRSDDLVLGLWTNSGITVAGTVVLDAEFEAVTNRIPTETEPQQFLKLNIKSE